MTSTTHTLSLPDGATLSYRAWLPSAIGPSTNAVLLFHRGHEHAARWEETVEALNLPDCAVFAWDQRGHGKSSGERGHAPDIATVAHDADVFARHLTQTHGIDLRRTVVVAHSVGAVIAAAWVHDFAPPVRGLVLVAPAFRVKLYVPLAIPALRLKQKLLGHGIVKSYVKARMLTHDAAQAKAYAADPLIFRQIAVNVLLDLFDTSTRLMADAGAFTLPLLVIGAGEDWVVKLRPQEQFFRDADSSIKQFDVLPDQYHALFHDTRRAELVRRIRAFILDRFADPARPDPDPSLLNADQGGHTRTEYDLLRAPESIRWPITRAFIGIGALLSEGMRIGRRYGFDSGVMLDHVYENRARGRLGIGALIDRFYLNAIGWRGIRIRGANLQRLLRETIAQVHASGRPVHILDIACGGGRYVLETMHAIASMPGAPPISAHLRDYKQENLDAAQHLARRLGLTNITFERADAFDTASLAAAAPRPTIAIVSGLYELFPENASLRRSLAGLAAAVEPGGYLLYTCQPWHPQVEFIARALTNREGNPWIMRRRTQAEMDALVRAAAGDAAGFEKLDQAIDPWGIFTVSVARRVSR
jgi:alpha-beta hydrolase superfamily lysophospholipase/SAM-dependent methyltransferase